MQSLNSKQPPTDSIHLFLDVFNPSPSTPQSCYATAKNITITIITNFYKCAIIGRFLIQYLVTHTSQVYSKSQCDSFHHLTVCLVNGWVWSRPTTLAHSSSGKDSSLSRNKQRFDSSMGYDIYNYCLTLNSFNYVNTPFRSA